jgi:RNA polymerase sigma-70 factor (ECF subfamily)
MPLSPHANPCNLNSCQDAYNGAGILTFMLVEFELIRRAQKGDETAFNDVVLAYRRRILGTIARLIGHPEDVEDVGQEVFLRLYFSLDQLRTPEVFEPWLYRLTVNASYDYLRKRRRRHESRMADLSEQQVVVADAIASSKADLADDQKRQTRDFVQELLSVVSEEDRLLLVMKEVEGLSLKEMEKIYNVNENALKVRLFRARQRVLKAMPAQTQPARAGTANSE